MTPLNVFVRVRQNLIAMTLIVGSFFLILPGHAEKKVAYPEFKTSSGFSRFIQGATGFTPLSGWMANRILRKELSKYVNGTVHSRLSLYSGGDLLAGKAKRIELSGQNIVLGEFVPLSDFQLSSVKDAPIYVSKSNRPILLKPIEFEMTACMSEADINQMLNSEKGKKMLTGMKVSIPPFGKQYLDIVNPTVLLEGERITIESIIGKHNQPIERGLPVKVSGKLSAERSRLSLADLDLQIEGFEDTSEIEQLVEAYFSEIVNLNHLKVDLHKVKVSIKESDILDRQLRLKAIVQVEPERKALEKYIAQHEKKAASKKH